MNNMNEEPFEKLKEFRKISVIDCLKLYRKHYLLPLFLIAWTLFLFYGLDRFPNSDGIIGIFLFSGFF